MPTGIPMLSRAFKKSADKPITNNTAKLGEIEGAMSSLSIAVSGILTVVAAMVYANFL